VVRFVSLNWHPDSEVTRTRLARSEIWVPVTASDVHR
jgi:hypothetical protein